MNLYLIGHDYRYAVEQMLLTLFPDERPVYPDGRPTGDRVELRLMSGAKVTTATCVGYYSSEGEAGRLAESMDDLFSLIVSCICWHDCCDAKEYADSKTLEEYGQR